VQVHAGFVALIFLEDAGNDGAGEARLRIDEGKCLGGKPVAEFGFLEGGLSVTVDFPLPITSM
jgi:hypothetical protein